MFYSGKGDDGQSELFGSRERFSKNEPFFVALGTVDELNSFLGICYAKAKSEKVHNDISVPDIIRGLQEDLFVLQARLAGAEKRMLGEQVEKLEKIIDKLSAHVPEQKGFVVAGNSELSAHLDFSRSVARRAERAVLSVRSSDLVTEETRSYLNRLSSVLYVLARYVADGDEQNPSYHAK